MRGAIIGVLTGLFALHAVPALAVDGVSSCARDEPSGERTLCHEAVIDAPVAEIWRLWTTDEGLRTWAAPVASIDLRPGGIYESSYDPDGRIGAPGNIRNRILVVAPNRLLVMQVASAPPGFAHETEIRQVVTTIELTRLGDRRTRVRVSMFGYREGAAFDELYRFFDWGNAWSLNKLQQRVRSGPVDWRAEAVAEAR